MYHYAIELMGISDVMTLVWRWCNDPDDHGRYIGRWHGSSMQYIKLVKSNVPQNELFHFQPI